MDVTFYRLVAALAQQGWLIASAEVTGSQREWMLPPGLTTDPAGHADVATAFSRLNLSESYVQVLTNGTTGQEMAIRVQTDYLSAAERAFRSRHMSAARCRHQAAARRFGHSVTGMGPLNRVTQYVQSLLVAGSK